MYPWVHTFFRQRKTQKADMNQKAKYEDEHRRAEQLSLNCRWLIDKIDKIFYAICRPDQIGTWQQRAEIAVLEAVKLSKTKTEVKLSNAEIEERIKFVKDKFGQDEKIIILPKSLVEKVISRIDQMQEFPNNRAAQTNLRLAEEELKGWI